MSHLEIISGLYVASGVKHQTKTEHQYPWWHHTLFTLHMWIFGHEQQTPSHCGCCGVGASTKQVGDGEQQVLLVEVSLRNTRILGEKTAMSLNHNTLVPHLCHHFKASPPPSASESENSPQILCTHGNPGSLPGVWLCPYYPVLSICYFWATSLSFWSTKAGGGTCYRAVEPKWNVFLGLSWKFHDSGWCFLLVYLHWGRSDNPQWLIGSSHHWYEAGITVFKPASIHNGGDDVGCGQVERSCCDKGFSWSRNDEWWCDDVWWCDNTVNPH